MTRSPRTRSALALTLLLVVSGVARSKPEPSIQSRSSIWHDPGDVSRANLATGRDGAASMPRPPFHFIEEDHSGTSPKLKVKDAGGYEWSVKWGPEAPASAFCNHFVGACGYFVETEYFIRQGRIVGSHDLHQTARFVGADGSFENARFQLRAKWPKFMKDHNWSWTNNPFQGTPQFNGLRILMMLLSNWDAKDARDFADGHGGRGADSNVAIFEVPGKPHLFHYFVSDWGATLGKWAPIGGLRNNWDCDGYAGQTKDFVRGVHDGVVDFGYSGTHGGDIKSNIHVADVRWLVQYLSRISDQQIRHGLEASGATPQQVEVFTRSIRDRIRQLENIAQSRQ